MDPLYLKFRLVTYKECWPIFLLMLDSKFIAFKVIGGMYSAFTPVNTAPQNV